MIEKNNDEELKKSLIKLKEQKKLLQEMNKKLKEVQKGELPIEEIKPFFERE